MTEPKPDKSAIRNAATVIVVRNRTSTPQVLMGQRGKSAAFMPSKFVFPGGAVDPQDASIPLARQFPELCRARIAEGCAEDLSQALAAAAIRELFEETGLVLGGKGTWPNDIPADWQAFARHGLLPDASALQYVFRAITPPGRPRRFDARFFLLDAQALHSNPDDFSEASDELSHLQWISLEETRKFDLPFITEVVLAEISARVAHNTPPASVPFFKNNDEESLFLRIHGHLPEWATEKKEQS